MTEDARGLHDQHDDQEQEHHRVLPDGQADGRDEDLGEADEQASDDGARYGADATEHGGDEGLGAQHDAHGGRGLRVRHGVEDRAYAGEGGAHGEGERDGGVHVDAHEAGGAHVLGHGTHGLAELGALDQEGEDGGRDRGHRDGEERRGRELQAGDLDRAGVDEGGHHLGVGPEHQLGAVLEEVRDADGGDQDGEARGVAQGRVGHLVDEHAQERAAHDREQHGQDGAEHAQ